MLSPDIYTSDQAETKSTRIALINEILINGDAPDAVIDVLRIQEMYLDSLIGVKDPKVRAVLSDAQESFNVIFEETVQEANRYRIEAMIRLQDKLHPEPHDTMQQDAWIRLSPETRQCLVDLAMSGRSGLTVDMQKYIGKRHLNNVLDTVNDVAELNQK